MDNRAIGIFDTDGGGLAAVRELSRLMPSESILYLCDTANAPYGGQSKELIAQNARRGLAFLQSLDVKLLLCACGTASAILADSAAKAPPTPLLTVLLPCAQEACAASVNGKIGLIGTPAAVRSGAYGRAVRNIRTDARVIGASSPLLDSFAESGCTPEPTLLQSTIAQYLEPLLREGVDTLILSSLAYVPLFGAISEATQYNITIIDPALAAARSVQTTLLQSSAQSEGPAAPPVWYVTDSGKDFAQTAAHFWEGPMPELQITALE